MDMLLEPQLMNEENNCSTEEEPPSSASSNSEGVHSLSVFDTYQFDGTNVRPLRLKRLTFPCSDRSAEFYRRFFPESSPADWSDWRWQLKNRITTLEQLTQFVNLSESERQALSMRGKGLPFAVTPYYMSLVAPDDCESSIRKTVIPVMDEWVKSPGEESDPLCEDTDSPVPGLIHRYPDRVLFLTTEFCSVFCRYCTRSRMVGEKRERSGAGYAKWQKAIDYIQEHTEIRDVILSGGDPLTMPTERLEWLLSRIRAIKHVDIIRIGTKVPVVLPQRITTEMASRLKKYHPLWMSIHFTHPDELSEETVEACRRLANAGIPLGSQTVLLKGVNDSVATMKLLMQSLMKARVRPYYLYQCDPITGSAHFRTEVSKGVEMIEGLRGHTSGYAVPHYVIDAPGGGGKIPLVPDYCKGKDSDGNIVLRNYEGRQFKYPEII